MLDVKRLSHFIDSLKTLMGHSILCQTLNDEIEKSGKNIIELEEIDCLKPVHISNEDCIGSQSTVNRKDSLKDVGNAINRKLTGKEG